MKIHVYSYIIFDVLTHRVGFLFSIFLKNVKLMYSFTGVVFSKSFEPVYVCSDNSQMGLILYLLSLPQGTFGNVKTFWLSQLVGAPGIWWVETRDAAKHSVIHGIAFCSQNYLTWNVLSAKVGWETVLQN